ncbi:hypothetical protein MKX07_001331 [Trichoderma sp. CBMAI-0711]|nr:hypothetical protein MKX07_001331 [Trichoderma sp. CBMAI-0711]
MSFLNVHLLVMLLSANSLLALRPSEAHPPRLHVPGHWGNDTKGDEVHWLPGEPAPTNDVVNYDCSGEHTAMFTGRSHWTKTICANDKNSRVEWNRQASAVRCCAGGPERRQQTHSTTPPSKPRDAASISRNQPPAFNVLSWGGPGALVPGTGPGTENWRQGSPELPAAFSGLQQLSSTES